MKQKKMWKATFILLLLFSPEFWQLENQYHLVRHMDSPVPFSAFKHALWVDPVYSKH